MRVMASKLYGDKWVFTQDDDPDQYKYGFMQVIRVSGGGLWKWRSTTPSMDSIDRWLPCLISLLIFAVMHGVFVCLKESGSVGITTVVWRSFRFVGSAHRLFPFCAVLPRPALVQNSLVPHMQRAKLRHSSSSERERKMNCTWSTRPE